MLDKRATFLQSFCHMKTITFPSKHSPSCAHCRLALRLISLSVACFALLPGAQAQLPSPTPDGGYPNRTTAEGTDALFNVDLDPDFGAYDNTALGFNALYNDTEGFENTATGSYALFTNTTGGANT